jgi:methionine-rich copper-binding protein CopC
MSRRQVPTVPRPRVAEPVAARAGRRRVSALVAGALLALAGPGLTASPAAAHDELTGSTPADGASVEIPPAAVELTFSEPPLGIGSQVQVTGPDGEVVNAGDLVITDTVVSQPLATDLPAGDYAVAWRVTSSDGHPISGELTFTAQGTAVPPEETATPEPAPVPGATSEPTTEPSTGAGAGTGATAEPAPESGDVSAAEGGQAVEDPSPGAAPWVVGAVIVLLVGGALWWVARRRAGSSPQGG